MTYAIGTPVLDHYGSAGFISDIREPDCVSHVIGAQGLTLVRHDYEVCFDSGRISVLSDGIVAPFVARAAHLDKVDNVAERRAAIKALQDDKRATANREAAEHAERVATFKRECAERVPAWAKGVIVAELREDRSDSMTDYYGSTTKRTVILGFSKHTRDLFPELRKHAATFEPTRDLATAPESVEHREKYSMGGGFYLKDGFRHSDGWQIKKYRLYNGPQDVPFGEWHTADTATTERARDVASNDQQAAQAVDSVQANTTGAASTAIEGVTIEEHTHTKKGFTMFVAVLPGRVERAEYERLLDIAKGLGGWYSRPWGRTPGGFAFKDRSAAQAFAGADQTAAAPTAQPVESVQPCATTPAPAAASKADKLRAIADGMQSDIDSKFADRLTNTPKRQRQADAARLDGQHLERTQKALRALADRHDSGDVPPTLATLTTKSAVHALTRSRIDRTNAGYYDAGIDTNEPATDSPQAVALWALIAKPSAAAAKAEDLRRKVAALQFANIPGYFPTPSNIVADMIEAADIPEDRACYILEPSAGSGAIADAIREARPLARIKVIERHASLRDVLTLKGYNLLASDFLDYTAPESFDRVLMNPPFENSQDIDHVRHAFNCLAPGGVLVAIMSPGPFFRNDRKAQAFRDWFESVGATKTDIPAGAFKGSGTGVATVRVVIRKAV